MKIAITGASSGIGEALAVQLAEAGHALILSGRDEARLSAVAHETKGEAIVADLSTIAGMRGLAESLAAVTDLEVMVHNAGVLPTERRLTSDGFEVSFAVNHLAPFIINEALRRKPPRRIVQVSAGAYALGSINLERGPYGEPFHPFRTYGSSKLWNLYATMELAKALPQVSINAVHPGVARTRLGDMEGIAGVMLRTAKRLWSSPEKAARGPYWLCTATDADMLSGRYFDRSKEQALRPNATIDGMGAKVVERTRALLKSRS